MYLIFDTETTGLPIDWYAPITEIENWPRMVQLAWLSYNKKGKLITEVDYIIKPESYTIPLNASKIHGITTEIARKVGTSLKNVLVEFALAIEKSDILIAHNMNFDEKIVGAEMIRTNIKSNLFNKHRICTMKTTKNLCKIASRKGYKWPKLSELNAFLFGIDDYNDAHNASVDAEICAKCFFKLKEMGHYKL
ncbi:3'-5' exonuclease [candidate division WOR-3 bacterium]|nr:3'-5' exonuclease [candidate division WOR-3 bacterium]